LRVQEHVVEGPGGRELTVLELGDPAGAPIVFHHGTPGSRKAHNQKASVLAGSRAIFYDRPGYGGSDREPGRDVAACAADVAAITDAFGIEHFAVSGSSGGGPHALACGALLPDRVTRVAVVAGFAPADDPDLDFLAGMSDLNVEELRAALEGEASLTRQLEAVVESASADPGAIIDEIVSELPEPDRRALARPDIRAVFRETIGESVRNLRGWIDDDLAFARPWGFNIGDVGQEALLLQGEFDMLVPRAHMAHIASKLPHGRLEILRGAGHTVFDEMVDVVRWLRGGA
jgi:pimeloyl-ACP methyl ester carboxylesterase